MTGVPLDDLQLGDTIQISVSDAFIIGIFTGYGTVYEGKKKIWVIYVGHRPIPTKLIHSIMYATEDSIRDAEGENT